MALGDNSIVPLYEPGTRITAAVTAAVTGGKFVRPSGNFQSGPLLSTASDGGNVQVATCGAGLRALGVAGYDGPNAGDKIPLICGHDIVVPMTAGAARSRSPPAVRTASPCPAPPTARPSTSGSTRAPSTKGTG
jgi:hypothetical protein